jgi:asparagine synthase (glutamine-hydrolysing)
MCGILGRVYRQPGRRGPLSQKDLAPLAHRGPDGSGVFANEHVQFGHTRLAIIDLSEGGRQPMSLDSGRFVVTYNGEIYNFLELRQELEALGERFHSRSDTEVLLVAYKVWGKHCVRRFRGMFAFALWDNERKAIFLARDRCGEKPLIFHRSADCIVFGSEMKAVVPLLGARPQLDCAVVDMYLHYQYVPEPFTLLQGIQKLPAGHTLFVPLDDWHAQPERYWDIEQIAAGLPDAGRGADPLSTIREGIEDAVTLTLRSDVPVGVALSGGIDSGLIAALAQKHYPEPMHAFCVGYPGRPAYDERSQARALAESLGMIVHEIELPVDRFVSFFPELVRVMDEPIADPAAYGHYSVPRAAAERGIKVLLTGIGGDELFWGYPWVAETVIANQLLRDAPLLRALALWASAPGVRQLIDRYGRHSRLPAFVSRWLGILLKLSNTTSPPGQLRFYMATPDFRDAFGLKERVYGPAMKALPANGPFRPTDIGARAPDEIPAAIIRLLFDTWLASNCLTLADRVSMSVGVESRLPFLDSGLIERVMALRAHNPDHRMGQKYWLRAASKPILPEEVLKRPKAGFQPPVQEWLSGVVAAHGGALRHGWLEESGIVCAAGVESALSETAARSWPSLFFAYKLVLLETWCQMMFAA